MAGTESEPKSKAVRRGTGADSVEQLRDDIDRGLTRDKVAVPDPATAPLGADDETAAPHDEAGLAQARAAGKPPG